MRISRVFLATLLILLAASGSAAAHKTTYSDDDKIKIVWGFLNDPATTWTKTGLDLILSDNATGAPIADAHTTLNATLMLGDESHMFADFRGQHGQVGRYTDVVTLTRGGLYVLHLKGTINGTAVDMMIPGAHEVEDISATYFPAPAANPYSPASTAALESKVATLESRLAALEAKAETQANTPGTITPATNDTPAPGALLVLGVVGVVALALVARRRR